MGETLQMASEKGAYAITDQGTYLAYKNNLKLTPLVTSGSSLLNIYSVMAVYNDKQPVENPDGQQLHQLPDRKRHADGHR